MTALRGGNSTLEGKIVPTDIIEVANNWMALGINSVAVGIEGRSRFQNKLNF